MRPGAEDDRTSRGGFERGADVDAEVDAGRCNVVVDEDVPHDGVQPPFDVRAFFKVVLVSQRFHKGFLHQIICVFTVTCEAHGETGKEILMRGQELVEFDR